MVTINSNLSISSSEMKHFIRKTLLFFVIFIVLLFSINELYQLSGKASSNDYLAAIIDKHEKLKSLKEPAIVFAGGSNLAYGLDCETVASATGRPTVNFGLHGALGISFMLEELKNSLKEGDFAVLSIEYFLDADGSENHKKRAIEAFPEARKYIKTSLIQQILSKVLYYQEITRNNIKGSRFNDSRNSIVPETDGIYSRKSFNEVGDVVAHLDMPPAKDLANRYLFRYRPWNEEIQLLNEFYQFCQKKKVAVVFMFPAYAESEFNRNSESILRLYENLQKSLQIPIAGTPQDFVFNDSLFFDSIYHLNRFGRDLRTEKVIELLKKQNLSGKI